MGDADPYTITELAEWLHKRWGELIGGYYAAWQEAVDQAKNIHWLRTGERLASAEGVRCDCNLLEMQTLLNRAASMVRTMTGGLVIIQPSVPKTVDEACAYHATIKAEIDKLLAPRPVAKKQATGSSDPPWPPDDGWHFATGKAAFCGIEFPLTGTPQQVIELLSKATQCTLSKKALFDQVWPDGIVGEDALKQHLKSARRVLRDAFQINDDPLPHCGSGHRAGWKIDVEILRRAASGISR